RAHGLRLQPAGGGVFPGSLRADADQASAQPLSENDVPGIDLLLGAGGALCLRQRRCRSFHLRHRRAAAQAAQEGRRRNHQIAEAVAAGRGQGVFGERQTPAQDLMKGPRMKFGITAVALTAAFGAGVTTAAEAQNYPAKSIRVIVSSSAGGTSDIFMR